MSEAGFTPGPWFVLDQRASTQRSQGFVIPGHDVILISSYAPSEINREHCDCIIARIDFSNRPEELGESNFADAKLIAAAPELYEQLVEAERLLSNHAVHDLDLPPIHAALSKARGSND